MEKLDVFGYSPPISVEVSKNLWEFWILFGYCPFISDAPSTIPGGRSPARILDTASEIDGEYPKSIQNSHRILDTPTEIGWEYPKIYSFSDRGAPRGGLRPSGQMKWKEHETSSNTKQNMVKQIARGAGHALERP